MLNIYLDTNIYIHGLLDPDTNSALILKEIIENDIIVTQSDYLIDEILLWFRYRKGKKYVGKVRSYLLSIPRTEYINKYEWSLLVEKYHPIVDDKDDLPHICSYLTGSCDYFVTVNRKLTQEKIKEKVNFITPKEFIEKLGLKSLSTVDDI
jgi:putative PIN family toxin of toxin-antitoxin system